MLEDCLGGVAGPDEGESEPNVRSLSAEIKSGGELSVSEIWL